MQPYRAVRQAIWGPVQELEEHQLKQESPDWSVVSRTAVLADAEGLLTCYGVGEESTGQLTHAVIELCFTSSVRFLQPGLLLQVFSDSGSLVRSCHIALLQCSGNPGVIVRLGGAWACPLHPVVLDL